MRNLIAGLSCIYALIACTAFSEPCDQGTRQSCPSGAVKARDDEPFMDMAWNEYVRRGGTYLRSNARFDIYREPGKVIVFVTLHPPFPGGHFEVTLDAKSGNVLKYLPGA